MMKTALKIFNVGVKTVMPSNLIQNTVSCTNNILTLNNGMTWNVNHNVYVVGFGKAVLGMAKSLEPILSEHLVEGVLSIPNGQQQQLNMNLDPSSKIIIYEGAKDNLPDEKSLEASLEITKLSSRLNYKDLLIVLVSGGGSSLFCLPVDGISLKEKQDTISLLSKAGATINELNTVRSCLSKVKGGKFITTTTTMFTNCNVLSLILSDIIDDPLNLIASGPTVKSDISDLHNGAQLIIDKYNLRKQLPLSVVKHLSLIPNDPAIPVSNNNTDCADIYNCLIGNNITSLSAMKKESDSIGFKTWILTSSVCGEASKVGNKLAQLSFSLLSNQDYSVLFKEFVTPDCYSEMKSILNADEKVCLLIGGETTVTVTGKGKGGRNQELALSATLCFTALNLEGGTHHFRDNNFILLSAGSDGQDGPTDAAGAYCCPSISDFVTKQNIQMKDYLNNNDSYGFYSHLSNGDYLLKTRLTGTNVMDFQIILLSKR